VSNLGSGNQSQARAVARNIFSLADREPVQVKTCKGRVLIGAPQAHLLQLAFKPIDAIRSAPSITFGFALGMTAGARA
jgi:hypothetical protein